MLVLELTRRSTPRTMARKIDEARDSSGTTPLEAFVPPSQPTRSIGIQGRVPAGREREPSDSAILIVGSSPEEDP